MARAIDWSQYDALKAQGLSERAIARELGIPWTTFYREKQKREGPPSPVQSPVHTPVQSTVQSLVQNPVHRLEERVTALEETVQSLVQSMVQNPVQIPVHEYAPPPLPRGKSTRWNMYILEPILAEIAARAKAREISPSRLAQELLWQALNDRRSSTP
jgi:hypothetical protein